jgi:hypothetical protein
MSKSDQFENDLLKLIFNGVAMANIADNAAISPAANLYVSFHKADPGEAGTQSTSEVAYGGYARVAVARTAGGWTVTGGSVSPTADISFPIGTAADGTITHFGVGTAQSGAGRLLYKGPITPNIATGVNVTPKLTTQTVITED